MSTPLVTGVSPKEGPPGTKLTIRGERLGKSQSDIISLEICGVNCLLTAEWVSPSKIIARTLLCRGRGEIVIITKSGGIGTSTVTFRGTQETVSLLKESAVWVDETVVVGTRPMAKVAYQQEDPLKISSEADEKKFPVEELAEWFPGQCGNLSADNFSPQWFLLESHHATTFEDLKSGLQYLSMKINSQSEGKVSFLKENMYMVMDQLDSLMELKKKCDKYDSRGNARQGLIPDIDEQIAVCEKEAAKMFQDVLNRKDRADVTRNALAAYQRFKFLLSLPGTMQRNIEKEDYDMAISDYLRSKTLFEQPEVQKNVFLKFKEKVEEIAEGLRQQLKKKLEQKPPNVDDQRVIIAHLMNLGVDYDPAWMCLMSHYEFLSTAMRNCFRTFSSSYGTQSSQQLHVESDQGMKTREVSCTDSICDIFTAYFTPFWQLSQEYFGNKLRVKPELSKQSDVKTMMVNSVKIFCDICAACIMPQKFATKEYQWMNASEPEVPWISACLSTIRRVFTKILTIDPPLEIVDKFRTLLFQIRFHSLQTMSAKMSVEISQLGKLEDWSMEHQPDYGFITALPSKLESTVTNSAKVMKEVLLQKYIEERSLLKSQEVVSSLAESLAVACAAFADAIESLLSELKNAHAPGKPDDKIIGSKSTPVRLLLLLNNCDYVKTSTYPTIVKSLSSLGFPNIGSITNKANVAVTNIQKLVFAYYSEMKYEPVVGLIEQAMFVGTFDWEKFAEPTGVRPYISKVLLELVRIVSEVTAVSERLKPTVLSQVVESVCEELLRLYSCVSTFSDGGATQAVVDIMAFRKAVDEYLTPTSKALLEQALGLIPGSAQRMNSREIRQFCDQFEISSAIELQPLRSVF